MVDMANHAHSAARRSNASATRRMKLITVRNVRRTADCLPTVLYPGCCARTGRARSMSSTPSKGASDRPGLVLESWRAHSCAPHRHSCRCLGPPRYHELMRVEDGIYWWEGESPNGRSSNWL